MRSALRLCLLHSALISATAVTLSAQGGLEVLGGIGELIGSFRRSPEVYVGTTRISVRKLGDKRPRVHLQGFSCDPPAGAGWYVASPRESSAEVVQTLWFINQPYERTHTARTDGATPSRPPVLAARLQFYGRAAGPDFTAGVRQAKTREWNAPGVTVVAFDVRPVRVGATDCADYNASLTDRRGPEGSQQQLFNVTIAGRACRHPGAPWLTVDVDATDRVMGGESRHEASPAWDAFMRSVTLDAFDGPIVEDVLLLTDAERPRAEGHNFRIHAAVFGTAGVWVSHGPVNPSAGVLSVSHIDAALHRTDVDVPVSGAVRGLSGDGVWVSGGHTASRVDAASHTAAPRFELQCSPWEFPYSAPLTLTAGSYGVWFSCETPASGKQRSVTLPSVLRRLDPLTGVRVGEIELPRPAREISGDAHRAWALEAEAETGKKRCRVHAIDLDANRLLNTVDLGAFSCRQLHATGEEAWLLRTFKNHEEIVKVDLKAGQIAVIVPVPAGRFPSELVVAGEDVWVSTAPEWHEGDPSLGSAGGLLRLDRATGHVRGPMTPTGTADRIIGARDGAVWLYDAAGSVVKMRQER